MSRRAVYNYCIIKLSVQDQITRQLKATYKERVSISQQVHNIGTTKNQPPLKNMYILLLHIYIYMYVMYYSKTMYIYNIYIYMSVPRYMYNSNTPQSCQQTNHRPPLAERKSHVASSKGAESEKVSPLSSANFILSVPKDQRRSASRSTSTMAGFRLKS